jgi:adenylate cyclase
MKKIRKLSFKHFLLVCLSVVFILHSLDSFEIGLLKRLENDAYDARMRLTMPNTLDERIVIIDIDEKSLAEVGRWPWRRDVVGRLVNALFDHQHIDTLGFDVVFAEPDSSGSDLLKALPEHTPEDVRESLFKRLDHDAYFAQSLTGRNVVLGYYFKEITDDQPNFGLLPKPAFPGFAFDFPLPVRQATGYGANLAVLQKQAKQGGHFNPQVDDDGVVRKVSLLIAYEGNYYASLSLAVAKAHLKQPIETIFAQGVGVSQNYVGLEQLSLGKKLIPVDNQVRALIPYRGKSGSFRYISASDVLNGRLVAGSLAGKIALLGTSAPGLLDLRSTPVEPVYPGVEIHANLIAGILDGMIKERPAWAAGAELIILLLIMLMIVFFLPSSPLSSTLITALAILMLLAFNLWLWIAEHLVLNIATPLLMLLLLYLVYMAYGFFVESRNKQLLSMRFGQYVPPELVTEMSANPENYSFEGESKQLTVLFSDVRGFTSISEGLSAKELAALMNEYLTPMTRVIHRYRGTIDKYMGDAIMAFWGAPLEDKNHARNAIRCALSMLVELKSVNKHFIAKGWPEIKMGIGLNTGIMMVGNMGSSFRMAYTVMGDEVNLGSRLEGITKEYGVALLVSQQTKDEAPEFVYRELDKVRVKGKTLPVTIYEPLGMAEDLSTKQLAALALFNELLIAYRNQDWLIALGSYQQLNSEHESQRLYELYRERIEHYMSEPPPANWDGVYTFTIK